jgi:hypothetical protein
MSNGQPLDRTPNVKEDCRPALWWENGRKENRYKREKSKAFNVGFKLLL